jgi:flagellar basal-body rod protein FlgF
LERGIISLGSSLMYLQQRMNTAANNIANSDTVGFKRDKTIGRSFNSFLSQELEKYYQPVEIRWNSGMVDFKPGVYADRTYTDLSQGRLEETGKNSDIALLGRGFIALQNNGEETYKRCVSLVIDDQGYLSDRDSGRLQGVDGYIRTGTDLESISGKIRTAVEKGDIKEVDILIKVQTALVMKFAADEKRISTKA